MLQAASGGTALGSATYSSPCIVLSSTFSSGHPTTVRWFAALWTTPWHSRVKEQSAGSLKVSGSPVAVKRRRTVSWGARVNSTIFTSPRMNWPKMGDIARGGVVGGGAGGGEGLGAGVGAGR